MSCSHHVYELDSLFLSGAFFTMDFMYPIGVPWEKLFYEDVKKQYDTFAPHGGQKCEFFPWFYMLKKELERLPRGMDYDFERMKDMESCLNLPLVIGEMLRLYNLEMDPRKKLFLQAMLCRSLDFYRCFVSAIEIDPKNEELLEEQHKFVSRMIVTPLTNTLFRCEK